MSKYFETGISHVTLFPAGTGTGYTNGYKDVGIPWSGVISLSETTEGGEPTALYADNIKYLELMSNENIKASIEAYHYPTEFEQCDGTANVNGVAIKQQSRKKFCLAYQTEVGDGELTGNVKLHFLYNCLAAPADRSYQTINESPNAMTFSWSITTTPVENSSTWIASPITKPLALLTVDQTKLTTAQQANWTNFYAHFKGGTFMTPAQIVDWLGTT